MYEKKNHRQPRPAIRQDNLAEYLKSHPLCPILWPDKKTPSRSTWWEYRKGSGAKVARPTGPEKIYLEGTFQIGRNVFYNVDKLDEFLMELTTTRCTPRR